MLRVGRRDTPFGLVVGMTGVKLGDRLVHIGCANGTRLGAIASKVGLSGRAVAVVPDATAAGRAGKGAANAGALVEIEIAPPTTLPVEDGAFDLAVIDDTDGGFTSSTPDVRAGTVREAARALRPGGRVMIIAPGTPTGLASLLGRRAAPLTDPTSDLQTNGFRVARRLADREGLLFFEGLKPRA